jgi:hypothetical protein
MSAVSRSLFLGAVLLTAAVPRAAAAEGRDPSAADALFATAREAMARGDMTTACARFAESQRLDPAPGTLLNVAQCEEREGKLAASYTHVNEVLANLPKDDFRLAYARAQLAALKPRVPTVTVTLAKGTSGARVTRDDVELREGSFGVPLPIDPGPHVFVVRANGREDNRQQLTLREGQQVAITLSVGSPSPVHDVAATAGDGRRTLAIGALSLGGVGLVTGVVTGLLFADSASTYRDHCDASGCDPDGLSAAARARTLNVVSPIAFGVGVVSASAGTYLLLTSKRDSVRRGSISVDPQVSPQLAGVTVTGGF